MKALSLTNLDRITELDFNRTDDVGAVGGLLSISKLNNLQILKAQNNKLDNVFFSAGNNTEIEELHLSNNLIRSLTNFETINSLEYVDLSYNSLSISDVDTVLTTLDTSGKTNGTVKLEGANALPTLGKYNTELLSLEGKGWTVSINGGIDARFTANEGYAVANTYSHPNWEGGLQGSAAWQNDPINGRITASSDWLKVRTSDSIRSQVGDTINVSVTFDYGDEDTQHTADQIPRSMERTLLIALADVGAFSSSESNLLNGTNLALMTKFEKRFNESTSYMRLYQKFDTDNGSLTEVIGNNSNWQPLAAAVGDKFTLTYQIQLGATKETSTVNVTITNDVDGNSLTGSYNLSNYADMYAAFVSSTSNVKLHFQAGEFADNSIEEINIYSATARVN
jgi:Leucine-rich repeat (LRR) protein